MKLVDRLLQGLSEEERQNSEHLCFVAHEFTNKDIRLRLTHALEIADLKPYFADMELTVDLMLRKICQKILATRAFIVDVSKPNSNVFFELGLAIGFNKPILAIAKEGCKLPGFLEPFVPFRFAFYADLEQELSKKMPLWFATAAEVDTLYSSHCHFLNVLCEDRNRISPGRSYFLLEETYTNDEQMATRSDADLRQALLTGLSRFDFQMALFDNVEVTSDFRFCDLCRASRDAKFGIVNISKNTTAAVYLFAGLYLGLGIDFLLLVHDSNEPDKKIVPRLLQGLDYLPYKNFTELQENLPDKLEEFLNSIKTRPLIDRVLIDLTDENKASSSGKVLNWEVSEANEDHADVLQYQAVQMLTDQYPRMLAYVYIGKSLDVMQSIERYLDYSLRHREPFREAYHGSILWPKSFGNAGSFEKMILDGFDLKFLNEIAQKLTFKMVDSDIPRNCMWALHRPLEISDVNPPSLAGYLSWMDNTLISSLPENTHVVSQLFVQTQNPARLAGALFEMLRSEYPIMESEIRIAHDIGDTEEAQEYWEHLLFKEQNCG